MHMPNEDAEPTNNKLACIACNGFHRIGYCPIKLAGFEFCGLCGLAHYGAGFSRNCPHLNSVTQCRAMLDTLRSSTEPKALIDQAKKYLVGVVGNLNRKKKLKQNPPVQPDNHLHPHIPPNDQSYGLHNGNGNLVTGPYDNGTVTSKENGFVNPVAPSAMAENQDL